MTPDQSEAVERVKAEARNLEIWASAKTVSFTERKRHRQMANALNTVLALLSEQQVREPVGAPDRAFVRHLIREMRAAIAANPEAPTITTGPLDPDILERVLNIALTAPPEQQVESGRLREALGQWMCDSCGGAGVYTNRSREGGLERVDCKRCSGTGQHPIARKALSPSPAQTKGPDHV